MAAATTTLYVNRRAAAREVLVGWLDRRGIAAEVQVERFELDGFVGRIVVGDPREPDVSIERVEVDYGVTAPWSAAGFGVTPSRIRLVRPAARVRLGREGPSFGSLDPLIEEFTKRPPRPDRRGPLIEVEQARVRIVSEYGPFQILGDARIDDGRLIRLRARMPAASLKSGPVEARGLAAAVDLAARGDRVDLKLTASAERLAAPLGGGRSVALSAAGDLPYPDLKRRAGDGLMRLTARLQAEAFQGAGGAVRDAAADIGFDGNVRGWLEDFRVAGNADMQFAAASMRGRDGIRVEGVRLGAPALTADVARSEDGFRWSVQGGLDARADQGAVAGARLSAVRASSTRITAGGKADAFEVTGGIRLAVGRLTAGDLTMRGAGGRLTLDMVRDAATAIAVSADLAAPSASFSGLGPAREDDIPELAAMKRAAADFAFSARGLRLTSGNGGTELRLTQAATATPRSGGRVLVSPGRDALYRAEPGRSGGGAFALISAPGGGLPQAEVEVSSWRVARGGLAAALDGRARLDFGPGRDIDFSTRGELTASGGRVVYAAADCVPISVGRLELGENDVVAVSGRACPGGGPLVEAAQGRWRARGRLEGVSAAAPFLGMRFEEAEGPLDVSGGPGGVRLEARVADGRVVDIENPARFLPLRASGRAGLRDDVWSGGFDLSRLGHRVGAVELRHDMRVQAGGAVVSAPSVVFAAQGLQPGDLSPLIDDYLMSPVEGEAAFNGEFAWSAEGLDSRGDLTVAGLDFESPVGAVKGLKGRVVFDSLTPLRTAPDQVLAAELLETATPVTDLQLRFMLDETALRLGAGQVTAAGGRIGIEPFAVPLTPGQPWSGVILVEQLQLNELLKSANLQDRARLDAVVSGRLPFSYAPETGWRISGGVLNAVRPGRLSIEPEVLDALAAGVSEADPALPPNTMRDLAYQALQDLAISDLTAEVDSLEEGRLGVRFRISGRHDPPQTEQLRLTIMELIRRDFMNKRLNLPSDTPIDLTLDTTWNANQIVSDVLQWGRAAREGREAAEETP